MKMRVRILAIAAVSAALLTSSLPAVADGRRIDVWFGGVLAG